jgi:predicted secreted Zn-dependent protease
LTLQNYMHACFVRRLAENIKSTGDLSKISGISNTIMKEWQEEQDDYDNETNHSMNEKKQAEWNLNLKQRLDALKEFASK